MTKRQRFEEKEVGKYDSSRDWAGLPEGILEAITEKLPVTDCVSFADVCKPWQSVLTQFPTRNKNRGFPWMIMSRQNSRTIRSCVSIVENNLVLDFEMSDACWWYLWGSFQDWLIMAKHIRKPYLESYLKLMLFNPFSKAKIDLPDVAECYHKMVLSTNPSQNLFVCMLLHQDRSQVAFWIPGAQEWQKLIIHGGPFHDAVFCGKSFYLVNWNYKIVKIDATSISSYVSDIKVDHFEVEKGEGPRVGRVLRYLVESCGEVLLVCRFFCVNGVLQTENFEVYRLDVCRMAWKKLKSLGDRILVLGKGCSRSFLAKELGIKKTNCIYFLNDLGFPFPNEWDIVQCCEKRGNFLEGSDESDWGIFSLGDEDNQDFCYRGNVNHWAPMCITAPQWWYCSPTVQV